MDPKTKKVFSNIFGHLNWDRNNTFGRNESCLFGKLFEAVAKHLSKSILAVCITWSCSITSVIKKKQKTKLRKFAYLVFSMFLEVLIMLLVFSFSVQVWIWVELLKSAVLSFCWNYSVQNFFRLQFYSGHMRDLNCDHSSERIRISRVTLDKQPQFSQLCLLISTTWCLKWVGAWGWI